MTIVQNPLLPVEVEKMLDAWIEERLEGGHEIVSVGVHDHRIRMLYPADWPRKRIAQSLRLYFKMREERWHVEHRENSRKYHVSKGEAAVC